MVFSSLFALPNGLEVAETSLTALVLTLSLVATASTAVCPLCGQASQHIRSSYTRHVADVRTAYRSEEHTSELQSHLNLVCRLLLEKKKKKYHIDSNS